MPLNTALSVRFSPSSLLLFHTSTRRAFSIPMERCRLRTICQIVLYLAAAELNTKVDAQNRVPQRRWLTSAELDMARVTRLVTLNISTTGASLVQLVVDPLRHQIWFSVPYSGVWSFTRAATAAAALLWKPLPDVYGIAFDERFTIIYATGNTNSSQDAYNISSGELIQRYWSNQNSSVPFRAGYNEVAQVGRAFQTVRVRHLLLYSHFSSVSSSSRSCLVQTNLKSGFVSQFMCSRGTAGSIDGTNSSCTTSEWIGITLTEDGSTLYGVTFYKTLRRVTLLSDPENFGSLSIMTTLPTPGIPTQSPWSSVFPHPLYANFSWVVGSDGLYVSRSGISIEYLVRRPNGMTMDGAPVLEYDALRGAKTVSWNSSSGELLVGSAWGPITLYSICCLFDSNRYVSYREVASFGTSLTVTPSDPTPAGASLNYGRIAPSWVNHSVFVTLVHNSIAAGMYVRPLVVRSNSGGPSVVDSPWATVITGESENEMPPEYCMVVDFSGKSIYLSANGSEELHQMTTTDGTTWSEPSNVINRSTYIQGSTNAVFGGFSDLLFTSFVITTASSATASKEQLSRVTSQLIYNPSVASITGVDAINNCLLAVVLDPPQLFNRACICDPATTTSYDGHATWALCNQPWALTQTSNGVIFFLQRDGLVRKISFGQVTTFAKLNSAFGTAAVFHPVFNNVALIARQNSDGSALLLTSLGSTRLFMSCVCAPDPNSTSLLSAKALSVLDVEMDPVNGVLLVSSNSTVFTICCLWQDLPNTTA
jgi:hypothetical protein